MARGQKKTHDKYIKEVKIKNPTIIVDDIYKGDKVKINHVCTICKHRWPITPNDVLHGYGCPVCSHQIIGNAPEYRNSIWASPYKEYFSKYMTEEQMKMYMPNSTKKICVICPDCHREKTIQIAQLFRQNLGCNCNDNTSYPNKFVFHVLSQLGFNIITEYAPKWANGKRYDIYMPDYNIIVENHGPQHYEEMHGTIFKELAKEQENDAFKMNVAIKNSVAHYVVLDCRKSSLEWIKNSILNSILITLLDINVYDIDWAEAEKYATKNLIKEAAILFDSGYSVLDISIKLHKHVKTIRKWLHTSYQLGWCKHEPSRKESKQLYCIELNRIFPSISNAEKNTNTTRKAIKGNCSGQFAYAGTNPETGEKLHWLYLNDAIQQGYVIN